AGTNKEQLSRLARIQCTGPPPAGKHDSAAGAGTLASPDGDRHASWQSSHCRGSFLVGELAREVHGWRQGTRVSRRFRVRPLVRREVRHRRRPWPPWWWKFVFSVSEPEKFLPQLPYNERSQCNQGLAIPLQAAFSTQTCLSSCQPSIRRI